ncbi:MAG: SUMF1/EgtB/PvdO family nonheme iron enzyme [Bacteroidota bacterium]
MADIFISYQREDRKVAEALASSLELLGYTTWWDTRLGAGESFSEVIEENLHAAKCVVVLWSRASVKSRWVRDEATEGLERGILAPVKIEEVKPPMGFRSIHTASLIGWGHGAQETAFVELTADIKRFVKPSVVESKVSRTKAKKEAVPAPAFTNSIGMEFVRIEPGTFMMGSNEYDSEKPVHQVTISKGFYLGKYPITQEEWQAVMGENPSNFKGKRHPVESISWTDAQEFIKRLNERESCHGCHRLPTEAEWEYACRAGTTTAYRFGDREEQLGAYAWYWENSGKKTHPVGQKQPNPWGLYDMHGNVWEWVEDWYGPYSSGAQTDPKGLNSGSGRVVRGGGWYDDAGNARSAFRDYWWPDARNLYVGFRVLRTIP